MLTFALRRLLGAIPLLLVATFVMFWIVSAFNDPLAELRTTCPNCSESAYQRLIDLYNLDQPIPIRYLNWLGNALTGDLGVATSLGEQPVSSVFWDRAKNTMILTIPAAVIIIILSLLLSVWSALRQYHWPDTLVTAGTYLGISMPTFFFGLVLQVFWGVWFQNWTGLKPFWTSGMHTESFGQLLGSMTLPIVTLTIISLADSTRYGRASMLESKNSEFVRTARAKGVPERTIVFKHILRAALIPIVTVWAILVGALLSGTLVTETIFAWPGLGRLLLNNGIFEQDVNVLMAVILFVGVVAVVFNLLADLAYGWLDPRVRYD